MPRSERRVTEADIAPFEAFAKERAQRRAALLPKKKLRRVEVGPYCAFYFESFDTMLFQIQEMLHIERGGAPQLEDELSAYNPLIPRGDELVATIMFEIDEPDRRERELGRLGGVEECFFIDVNGERIAGVQETDVERTRDDGKASSVQFAHFRFSEAQRRAFAAPDARILVGVSHPHYAHMAALSEESRAELSEDFA
jgi:hypothetical protein